ncbi:MAG: HAD hydrolase-like protein [Rhizomicrobium sp.]|jgi:phosphoglycolate phosphatase
MRARLLVCDLDNTLYDWVGYFVPSFYAMVDAAVEITDCDREKLLDDFRYVHQRSHDSEQPFALLETETVKHLFEGMPIDEIRRQLDPAFHAFNSARKRNLALYPGVRETLDALVAAGLVLVAHTESKLYGVVDRLRRLDLHRYFSKIYCRERTIEQTPAELHSSWFSGFPMNKIIELSHHQSKPNRSVLLEICRNEGISHNEAAYVGDSVARDVLMAKRADVYAIWAKYGAQHNAEIYAALVRVSHWTSDEVEREKELWEEAKKIKPDFIARDSFIEIASALDLS